MKIYGLQKTTLLDFPGKVACTVFTAGCNFRCPFCHNASLLNQNLESNMETSAFFDFLQTRKGKLDGVCVTGGEPTIQTDLADFLRQIKSLGFLVKLDTNGSRPKVLKQLLDENLLDYVAMDIKNSPEEYAKTAGVCNLDVFEIEKSINILLNSNIDYEFRTTIVEDFHDRRSIVDAAKWVKGAKLYVLQKFAQSDDILGGSNLKSLSDEETDYLKSLAERYVENVEIRGI